MIDSVSIGELADVIAGGTPARSVSEHFGGPIPWVKIGDMLQGTVRSTGESLTQTGLRSSSAKVLPAGTLLLSIFATIGRTAVLGVEAATNQAIAGLVLRDASRVDRRYLRQYLDFASAELAAQGRGVAQANINLSILRSHQIPLPPMEEQRRIAAVLDAADALRAKRRQALAKLDTLTQSIFIDMFAGDDDQVPIGHLVTRFDAGKSVAAPEQSGGRYRVLKVSAVTSTEYRPSESKPTPPDHAPNADHVVRPGDLLMSRANTTELVGACAFVHDTPPNHLLPDKLWRFVWRDPTVIEPLYLWHVLRQPSARRAIGDLATGSSGSMKNISQEKFKTMPVALPPIDRQHDFVQRIERVHATLQNQRQGLSQLDTLFASLQQRAFRGEL